MQKHLDLLYVFPYTLNLNEEQRLLLIKIIYGKCRLSVLEMGDLGQLANRLCLSMSGIQGV